MKCNVNPLDTCILSCKNNDKECCANIVDPKTCFFKEGAPITKFVADLVVVEQASHKEDDDYDDALDDYKGDSR